jgi:hypothetical protein
MLEDGDHIVPILNHYGYAWYGVQCSWGVSQAAVELVKQRFSSSS